MRRSWRLLAVAGTGVVTAVVIGVSGVALNVATGGRAPWFPTMQQHYLLWLAGATAAVAACGLLGWRSQWWYERGLVELVPAAQMPEPWMVDRPAEREQIVRALLFGRERATVGISTAVQGAGGFGKTTMARLVRCDRRVLRRFGRRVYWVRLGRDARGGALVEKVNDLVRRIDPAHAHPFTDVHQAAEHLRAVLARGPRRLIIVDDVWFKDQLDVFPVSGRCVRLVTTRIQSLAAAGATPCKVDQMSAEQARRVLTADLRPAPPTAIIDGLLAECGRWPLLLRLVNKILADQARSRSDLVVAASELLRQLRHNGAMHVDELTGGVRQLNINDPGQRDHAVAATIQASTGLLDPQQHTRFTELAIFVEDETIPVSLVTMLWQRTAGLDDLASRNLCARLNDLALLTLTPTAEGGTIGLHDVVRDYLHNHLAPAQVTGLHHVLLEAATALLCTCAADDHQGQLVAWWELPESARYLRKHLLEHLLAAGRQRDAETLATDLRWVASRLEDVGPLGPIADLADLDTPRTARLSRLLSQTAHLLTPTTPPHSLVDILYALMAHDPDWGPQARTLAARRTLPALTSTWPLPDLPPPALRRTLTGDTGLVSAVAINPDGTWLAVSGGRSVRIWDAATGELRTELTNPFRVDALDWVYTVAVAPDGTWLATGGEGWVRIWDVPTGELRKELTGHTGKVHAVAIAPDGTWLATGDDRWVRIWDAATGELRTELTNRFDWVYAVAVAPDGTWLAAGGYGWVRIWDAATGELRTELTGHTGPASAMAIAPDGTWLAVSGNRSVRIWDAATGELRGELSTDANWVHAVAIAPDGTWLAIGGDRSLRIWDVPAGELRAELTGHNGWVEALAIAPDGTWLAVSGAGDRSVRIWNVPTTEKLHTGVYGHTGRVSAVAVAPDGTWLATAGEAWVRIWDAATGELRTEVTGHTNWVVHAVAVAPDRTWLATAGEGWVQIWDIATGEVRTELTGHTGPVRAVGALAIAPDGTWLAVSGEGWVRIWDTATGELRTELSADAKWVSEVAVAPDGTWLATVGTADELVRIWDAATGELRTELSADTHWVHAVAIAPDGTWLATGGPVNGSVRTWDAATGELRTELTGHTGSVDTVAISPDGAWLATASSSDRSVRIWDVVIEECCAMMRTEKPPSACAWDPHGHALIGANAAGLYRFEFHPRRPAS